MDNKQIVLITGVGKRIGFQLAKHLLSKDYRVIGTYRTRYSSIDELEELGAALYCCDFYDKVAFDSFVEHIQNSHDSLRAVIHNASDWLPDNCEHPSDTVFERMMQIHAQTPYLLNLALSPLLKASKASLKDIIHFTDYVVEKGSKKHIAYAASKAALDNLTLSFAASLAPDIKVNSIAPALIKFNQHDSESYKEKAVNKSLMKVEGGYQAVIDTVDYLMQSNYVTGRTLALDGGRHLV